MPSCTNVAFCILLVFGAECARSEQTGTLLERANSSYLASRHEEAVQLYRAYLAQYPDRADVRVFLGAALLSMNRNSEALEQALRAIEIDPHYAKGFALGGRVHAELQDWSIAEEFFIKALAIDPQDRDTLYFLGRMFCAAGRSDKAVDALLQAIKVGGDQSRVYEQLGLAYDSLRQSEKAESAYRLAIKSSGSSYRSHLAYGVFLFKHARLAESLMSLRKALELQPLAIPVRFELGRALLQNGQVAEAIEILGPARDSHECRVHRLLSKAWSLQGNGEMAADELKRLDGCVESRS